MNERKIIDMNSPREKYFGWFPREKKAQVFLFCNIVYIFFCCFVWPNLPPKFIWGWWTSYQWTSNFIIANWAAIMWGVYYFKIWPLLDDGYDEGYVADEVEEEEVDINE